jgi:glycosyltransferase involved in cell wall biosynthesis
VSQRRPTVALVAHGIHDHGGMERAFFELVKGASDRFRFVVVSAELAPELRELVVWRRTSVPMRPIPLKTVAFALTAAAQLVRTRADLVHTLGAIVPNHADVATVQFCSTGFVRKTRSLAPAGPPLRRLNTSFARLLGLTLERWCYRPARLRALAPVSNGIARELERSFGSVPQSLTPNGVDVARFAPNAASRATVRNELGAGDELVALFVGGDWNRKGLGIAIEALRAVPDLHLWVVGEGDVARFAARAEAAGVGTRVRFLGRRADTERFYAAADIFVFPTLYEAAPLVAYEAAASALPIVATAVNGLDELLVDCGLAVERSAESVAAALARLAADPDLRRRLGAAGRARAATFTWQSSVEKVVALYNRLLEPAA